VSAERRNLPAVVEAAAPVKAATLRCALAVPAVIAGAGDHAARRFLEFFAATIRNKNTRMAYYRAICYFFAWVGEHEIGELADIPSDRISEILPRGGPRRAVGRGTWYFVWAPRPPQGCGSGRPSDDDSGGSATEGGVVASPLVFSTGSRSAS
jgi:hypothetical protein